MQRRYSDIAFQIGHIFIVFLALNVAIGVILGVRDYFNRPIGIIGKHGAERLQKLYPTLQPNELKLLLHESWSRPYEYEAFTHFKERAHSGTYVNVETEGYRRSSAQSPWPPSKDHASVFVFGGSTTFGYGVTDAETIPSHLQDSLRKEYGPKIQVYNFGRGFYYSSQELVLLQNILKSGLIPTVAVFIDGLNEFYFVDDVPALSDITRNFFNSSRSQKIYAALGAAAGSMPIVDLAYRIKAKLSRSKTSPPRVPEAVGDRRRVQGSIQRYLSNKRMIEAIAKAYGILPVFVWQPVPTYKYDAPKDGAALDLGEHEYSRLGYPLMLQELSKGIPGQSIIWCADIQSNGQPPLYIDSVHYSGSFSRTIADCAAGGMKSDFPIAK